MQLKSDKLTRGLLRACSTGSSRLRLGFLPALLLGLFLLDTAAVAELQWYGDPDKGRAVFDNLNFEGGARHSAGSGTILPATDPVHGRIWQVHKPAPDKRAEIRGAKGWSFHEGKGGVMRQEVPYFIGWRYKFELPDDRRGGWTCFQWKSYPDPDRPETFTQNYPLTMGYNGRELSLTKHGAGWSNDRSKVMKLWSQPVKIGTWVDLVLVINPSRDEKTGYVELYFNGKQQTLLTGGTRDYCKTMDGLEVAPKWGAYNKNALGTEITVDLADLRIGTDLESVMPKPVAVGPARPVYSESELRELTERANKALQVRPLSVTQKTKLAPSGHPHDYASTAPFFWPDPAKPDGRPYIRRDGEVNPESRSDASDYQRAQKMSDTVATLARAYEATRNEEFAAHAAKLLRAWFLAPETCMTPHLNHAQAIPGVNDGRHIGIIEGSSLVSALEQGRRLTNSAAWRAADQAALMKWAASFLSWYVESPFGQRERDAENNHGTHYDIQVMRLAFLLGRTELARQVAETAKQKRIAAQIEPDGRQPHELERATSFSYTRMNLAGLMSLANLAERVDVDLWHYESADGRSIRKALDFVVPYLKDPAKKWPGKQIKGFDRGGYASMLRQAAEKFNEPGYEAVVRDFPGIERASFQLLNPAPLPTSEKP
jgi:hypothetical protein